MKLCKDVVYGIIILGMAGFLIYQFIDSPIKKENNVAEIIKWDLHPPTIYQDRSGNTHAQKEVLYIKDEAAALYFRTQMDSVTKQLQIKDSQIAGLTTAAGKSTHRFKPNITAIEDSLRKVIGYKIDYDSKWFSLQGNTAQVDSFKAITRDSITLAFIREKYGFLNLKERLKVDIASANPDMKYYNVKSWMVPPTKNNKSRIGFGATVGYGLQFNKNNDISHGLQMTGGLQIRF